MYQTHKTPPIVFNLQAAHSHVPFWCSHRSQSWWHSCCWKCSDVFHWFSHRLQLNPCHKHSILPNKGIPETSHNLQAAHSHVPFWCSHRSQSWWHSLLLCSDVFHWFSHRLQLNPCHKHHPDISAILVTSPIHYLAGLVVKASASSSWRSGVQIPLAMGFFRVESYQWLKTWHSSGYPARTWRYRISAGVSILWLGEVESLICNFCLSVAAHKISVQICPWDTLVCCWDVKQPTNQQIVRFWQHLVTYPVQPCYSQMEQTDRETGKHSRHNDYWSTGWKGRSDGRCHPLSFNKCTCTL